MILHTKEVESAVQPKDDPPGIMDTPNDESDTDEQSLTSFKNTEGLEHLKDFIDISEVFKKDIDTEKQNEVLNPRNESVNVELGTNINTDLSFNTTNKLKEESVLKAELNTSDFPPTQQEGPIKASLVRNGKALPIAGGLDFRTAVYDEETGKKCILKMEEMDTVEKVPILHCTHR